MSYSPNPFSDQPPQPAQSSNSAAIVLTVLAVLCGIGLLVCGGVIVGGVFLVRQVDRQQVTVQDVNDSPFYTQADLSQYYSHRNSGQYTEARAELDKVLAFYPDDAMLHNELAWLLATCPSAEMRNGTTAVEHATRACELTNWTTVAYIDTLAAAYAESGDFDSAVKWQQTAIDKDYRGAFSGTGFTSRLELYKNRQTYQEGPVSGNAALGGFTPPVVSAPPVDFEPPPPPVDPSLP